MKQLKLIACCLLFTSALSAQICGYTRKNNKPRNMYISVSTGISYAIIDLARGDIMSDFMYGFGPMLDIKIERNMGKRFFGHIIFNTKTTINPLLKLQGERISSDYSSNFDEFILGIGGKYLNNINGVYFSSSLGITNFRYRIKVNNQNNISNIGAAIQFTLGKTWQINKRWAYNLAFAFNKTHVNSTNLQVMPFDKSYDTINSNSFSILLGVTLN